MSRTRTPPGIFSLRGKGGSPAVVSTGAMPARQERRHRQADLAAIELDAIAADVACLFEALDPLHDGGSGEADFVGDGLVTRAAVLPENAENPSVGGVELSLGGHLGGSPRDCPTIRCWIASSVNAS